MKERSQPLAELEGGLLQDRRHADHGPRQRIRDKSKPPDLTNSGVGGVQMAEVEVDTETGIVKVKKMVAVQDCGLVIDLKTGGKQVLRRADHGHQLLAVRRESHGPDHRPHAECRTWSSTGSPASTTFPNSWST